MSQESFEKSFQGTAPEAPEVAPQAVSSAPDPDTLVQDAAPVFEGLGEGLEGLHGVTDIHLHALIDASGKEVLDEKTCLIFPGPKLLTNDREIQWVQGLYKRVKSVSQAKKRREFSVRLIGEGYDIAFRAQRVDTAIDGVWYRLRRSSTDRVALDALGLPYPSYIEDLLLSPDLLRGGLVLVGGQPGSGKTTCASGVVVSRLEKFGGFAYTIEDPPEILSLNGMHGKGYCTQTEVYSGDGGWSDSIKDLLRSQPVGSNLILYLGEIRDVAAAHEMIRAAGNGFLVITTIHASSVVEAIGTVFKILSQSSRSDVSTERFAAVLRLAVYQKLSVQPVSLMEAQALYSEDSNSMVANAIRMGQLNRLSDIVHIQRNQILLGNKKERTR